METFIANLMSPWGMLILVAYPTVFLLSGFVIKKRRAAGRSVAAPSIMRYLVLPMAVIHLGALKIAELPADHIVTKITETALTIVVMSFLIQAMNYLVFSKHNIFTGRESIPKLGRDVLHFVFTIIVAACVLSSVWELNLGNLLTALGVSSLVIGLALQEPLGNLFHGIALLMASPFRKGDWVEIDSEKGKVVDFNWRSVKILNRANELIILPNNMIGRARLKNLSRPSRVHAEYILIGFSYDDHPQQVKDELFDLALQMEGVLSEPPPEPVTLSYDDFAISYRLKFYIQDYDDEVRIKDRIMTGIYDLSKKLGFTIPFPIRDIHLNGQATEAAQPPPPTTTNPNTVRQNRH